MPANLTPEYQRAERAFRQADTTQEKISALEQMLATIPKHKGTDKMQGDLKRRLSKMRQAQNAVRKGRSFDPFAIQRNGAGQVLLIGQPNVGKSSIVQCTTNAKVNVAQYPYSTHLPVPGMARFEDIQIQIVDMPPYSDEGFPPGMVGTIRTSDILALVVDANRDDLADQVERGMKLLAERQIVPKRGSDQQQEANQDELILWYMPMIVLCNKIDLVEQSQPIKKLEQLYANKLEFLAVSAASGENLDAMIRRFFEVLDVVRVYAKPPGKKPDMDQPFVLKRGSTVVDLASSVHRDLTDQIRYARIWGSDKFAGQQVQQDYILQDKDVIELHTR